MSALAIWQWSASTGLLPADQTASPADIVREGVRLFASNEIMPFLSSSASRLVIGLSIGCVTGVFVALVTAIRPRVSGLTEPSFRFLATLPVIVWLPFAIMLFGTGEWFKIGLTALSSFFYVFAVSLSAFRGVSREFFEVAQGLGKTKGEIERAVLLPGALPSLFSAVRAAAILGWVVLFFGEYAAAEQGREGLGWFVADARHGGRIEQEFVGLILLAAVALVLDGLLQLVEKRSLSWASTIDTG